MSSPTKPPTELSALVHSRDWAGSSVGPRESWSLSLQTVLRLMLTSRYAMWLGWGADLTFFYNDAYAEQTLGPKHPWALGRPTREVWAEIWDQVGPRIDHVLKTGEATWDAGLLLFLMRNGYPEETYHTFSYSPAPGDNGEIAGLFCVVIEETERVIGERRLKLLSDLSQRLSSTKKESEVFRALEEVLRNDSREFPFSLTYKLVDGDSNANPGAASYAELACATGISLPSSAPAFASRLEINDDVWPLVSSAIDPVLVSLATVDPKFEWPRGPWESAPTHALAISLHSRGNVGTVILGLNPHRPVDEGARKFAELLVGELAAGLASAHSYEEERRRAEALAALDRAKTTFFSNVSHEFRTPLTLMIGPTEDALASRERRLEGESLEVVHRNELRLLRLVNTLLDFARLEEGRVQATYEPTDLGALTADLASTFRSAVERGGLRFDVSCPKLPEPVWIDHDMWEKIVLNLLSNALKFTFEGSIKVELTPHGTEGAAKLIIADTGVGIPPSELPRLFERFHRIEGTKARTHEGSGIGLALVRDLVALHGGEINVSSEVGKGTTFRILIPGGHKHLPPERVTATATTERRPSSARSYVAEAFRWFPDDNTSAPVSKRTLAEQEANLKRPRVLIVDDNADMREYLERLLSPHWNIESAHDGLAALESIRARPPAVVITDVMMPRLDGFGLLRAIREDVSIASVPVILLSARAGEEAVAEGLRAGADDYLVKPFSASTLVVRVESLLATQRSRAAHTQRLATMVDKSPAAMAIVRGENLIVEVANTRILKLWGREQADVLNRPLVVAVPELEGQGLDEILRGVLRSGTAFTGNEARVRLNVDGTGNLVDRYFDFVYAPIHDDDGKTVRSVLIHAFDVTELVNARRAAEDANRMKDEFLATMSHELRTPLNAILGWASLLRSGRQDEAMRAKALATIERNAKAQARIVEDVLDVSRIVSGKLRLDIQVVDVATLVNAAVDVVRPAAEGKGIKLEVSVGDDVTSVNGDPDRLQQIIWNLLSNAVRFTPPEGRIAITVARDQSQQHIVIRVTDSGIGISKDHLPHVFERFRQVDSSTTRLHGGLGLGLAIVRHLVELHGGTVAVASEGLDRGTTFTVELPARATTTMTGAHAKHSSSVLPVFSPSASMSNNNSSSNANNNNNNSAQQRRPGLDGVHVLAVDDDDDSREMIATALEAAGAKVTLCGSAEEAFELIQRAVPDLVISDIGMPGEDGYSLLRRIRTLPQKSGGAIPAIALTAYARKEDEKSALAAGYQEHVAKPVDPTALVAAVLRLSEASKNSAFPSN